MKYTLADAVTSAAQADATARKAEKRNNMRRFTWCRLHHELFHAPLWRLVARRAGVPMYMVRLFVIELEVFASTNTPRGSVEGLNVEAMAADWALPDGDALARIYAALEQPDIGWLDQEHIVSFHDRNPDTVDDKAAERMRRMRARRKEASGAVTRNPRNVTTRSDQIIKQVGDNAATSAPGEGPQGTLDEGVRVGSIPSNSGESGNKLTEQEEARVWLATEGARILLSRGTLLYKERANFELKRFQQLAGDDLAMMKILIQADTSGRTGGKFLDLIRNAILAHRRELTGQRSLPLQTAVKRRG
jgi:hypothetical protein